MESKIFARAIIINVASWWRSMLDSTFKPAIKQRREDGIASKITDTITIMPSGYPDEYECEDLHDEYDNCEDYDDDEIDNY